MGKLIDLTGKKFGRLTVIERSYPNAKDGSTRWLCKCNCSGEKVIRGESLRVGSTKSCGCLHKERTRKAHRLFSGLASMREKMGMYKGNAKKKGYSFKLTEKQFSEITKQDCFYCGAKPSNVTGRKRKSGNYIYNGLDRVDNTKGYTIDNVVPCCRFCNNAKSNHTLQEFKEWSERLYKKMFLV